MPDPAPVTEPAASEADARAVLEALRALLSELGHPEARAYATLDSKLERELGLGSLERVDLLTRIGEALHVSLPPSALVEGDTLRAILACAGACARARADAASGAGGGFQVAPLAPEAGDATPAPEAASTLTEVLARRAAAHPERPAIYLVAEGAADRVLTYGALVRNAGRLAAGLLARGLAPGGRVAIMLPTSEDFFTAFFGALVAGGVPVPIYPPLRPDRIAEYVARQALILRNAEAELLVTFDRAAAIADLARDRVNTLRAVGTVSELLGDGVPEVPAVPPDATAFLQYTSGSTGEPKGVDLTHAAVLANVRAIGARTQVGPRDIMSSWLPLYHDMGLVGGVLYPLYFGIPTVIQSPIEFLTRPESWLWTIHRHRASLTSAPNFAFELCCRKIAADRTEGLDLSSWRITLNGSEAVLPETIARFQARFGPHGFRPTTMTPAYGLAEATVGVAMEPGRPPRIEAFAREPFEKDGRMVPPAAGEKSPVELVSCGRPLDGYELRVVSPTGEKLPERCVGRLEFRGPSSLRGYYRNPAATRAVLRDGGWVDTGDLAFLAEGELFIAGREKELIKKAGRSYHPHEIEQAVAGVPGIRPGCIAAIGLKDAKLGTEAIVVVAETREPRPADREAVARAVNEAVAEVVGSPPDRVVLCPPGSVPKTSSGKLRRGETRRLLQEGLLGRRRAAAPLQLAALFARGLPARGRAAGRRVARLGYALWIYALFVTLTPCFWAALRVSRKRQRVRRIGQAWSRWIARLGGYGPHVRGLERIPSGPAVLVANHQSYLDPIFLHAALDTSVHFVSKLENARLPFAGSFLTRAGHIYIDRSRQDRSLDVLKQISEAVEGGGQVLMYPEGTFTPATGLRPFKLGAFRVAVDRRVPVIPIVLRGARRALRDGTWLPRRARIEIDVLDPLHPEGEGIAAAVALRDRAAEVMAARLDEPRLHLVAAGPPG
ncbi:MAG: AMP-binding protein [Planctomycetes bacterium]|nr:AMP-binding protein [Planctomycetota bacterium]